MIASDRDLSRNLMYILEIFILLLSISHVCAEPTMPGRTSEGNVFIRNREL